MPPTIAGTPTAAGRYVSKTEMTTVATAKAMIETAKMMIAIAMTSESEGPYRKRIIKEYHAFSCC